MHVARLLFERRLCSLLLGLSVRPPQKLRPCRGKRRAAGPVLEDQKNLKILSGKTWKNSTGFPFWSPSGNSCRYGQCPHSRAAFDYDCASGLVFYPHGGIAISRSLLCPNPPTCCSSAVVIQHMRLSLNLLCGGVAALVFPSPKRLRLLSRLLAFK